MKAQGNRLSLQEVDKVTLLREENDTPEPDNVTPADDEAGTAKQVDFEITNPDDVDFGDDDQADTDDGQLGLF
jgi:hypothetical protein